MSIDSQVAASDETDRLCDDTIELIGSFGRMLAKARAAKETADSSSVCPCGRSIQRHQRNHRQLRAVSSNVSNLDDVRHIQPAGRVLTSPNEIRLLLRLESWINDNGKLVVKPSLHREQSATMEGCSFGNNSTLQLSHGPLCSDSSENVAIDCGAGAGAGFGDGDCCEASDEEAMQPALQPVEPPAEQRQQRPLLKLRKEPQQQEQPPALEPTAVSSAKPSRQQLLQQRRERLQSKRSASAAKVNVGGTVGGRARREVAAVPVSAQQQQQQPPRRRLSRGGGDSTTLIQKLHRLLSAEMKRSG